MSKETGITLIDELRWRGMVQDITDGAEKILAEKKVAIYAGFDPTAPSLQIGNLAPIMLLAHFQRAGHTPVALVGGATGMIGDPSGKVEERTLLPLETVRENVERFRQQLRRFLQFEGVDNKAQIVNNYDWFKDFRLLDFLRDVGKRLTVNYMMAKESVRQRLEGGLSFAEFSYQLLQAYDFRWLYVHKNCTFQAGGSDQWGNMTAGAELIRRIDGGEAHALTCPLITKSDGTKFGKSAAGEKLFLDPSMTSPYRFYQFWLNIGDEEAARFIRIFTFLSREEIEGLEQEQGRAAHLRPLQKALARDITSRVHSPHAAQRAIAASEALFGPGGADALRALSAAELLEALEGVPQTRVARESLDKGMDLATFLTEAAEIFSSKSEARRMISGGGVFVNKTKISDPAVRIGADALMPNGHILVQRGKKNYHLVRVE